ncbi:MAG: glycosyltransferase, partial [Acinetobacter sp.]
IIIDKKSTDNTLQIVNKYADKLTLVSEMDAGIYDAMNKGIAMASGELIGLLNSDDWYEKDAVEIMVNAYLQQPEIAIFHGLLRYIDIEKKIDKIIGQRLTHLKNGMIAHPTCFVHKRVYQTITFDQSYRSSADYDFMIRAEQNGFQFYFVEKLIANFRTGGISSSFAAIKETLVIQRKYKLINGVEKAMQLVYFLIKYGKRRGRV